MKYFLVLFLYFKQVNLISFTTAVKEIFQPFTAESQHLNNPCHFRKKECENSSVYRNVFCLAHINCLDSLRRPRKQPACDNSSALGTKISECFVSLFFEPETRDAVAKQTFRLHVCERNPTSLDVSMLFGFSTVGYFHFSHLQKMTNFTSLLQLLPEVEKTVGHIYRCGQCSLLTK